MSFSGQMQHKSDEVSLIEQMWALFRRAYSPLALISCVTMYIIAGLYYNTVEAYLFYGACLSTAFSVTVLLSYRAMPQWRRHPAPIIVQRTLCNFAFSVIVISNFLMQGGHWSAQDDDTSFSGSRTCLYMSYLIQFAVIAGECWMLMVSVDLVYSLTNPFISYQSYLNRYHVLVWSLSVINLGFYASQQSCQGIFIDGICWIPYSNYATACFVYFYLAWSVLFYCISIAVLLYATVRLSRGLEATFHTRKNSVKSTFGVVAVYVAYGTVLCVIYATMNRIVGSDYHSRHDSSARSIEGFLAFLVGCRGFFDSIVWFTMVDYSPRERAGAGDGGGGFRRSLEHHARQVSFFSSALYCWWVVGCCRDEDGDFYSPGPETGYAGRHGMSGSSGSSGQPGHANENHFLPWRSANEPLSPLGVGSADATPLLSDAEAGSETLTSEDRPTNMRASTFASTLTNPSMYSTAGGPARRQGGESAVRYADSELPQLNMALRREVLHCATEGIKSSILAKTRVHRPEAGLFMDENGDVEEGTGRARRATAASTSDGEDGESISQSVGGQSTFSSSCDDGTYASSSVASMTHNTAQNARASSRSTNVRALLASAERGGMGEDHSQRQRQVTPAKQRQHRYSTSMGVGDSGVVDLLAAVGLRRRRERRDPLGDLVYFNCDIGNRGSVGEGSRRAGVEQERQSGSTLTDSHGRNHSLHESIASNLRASTTVPYAPPAAGFRASTYTGTGALDLDADFRPSDMRSSGGSAFVGSSATNSSARGSELSGTSKETGTEQGKSERRTKRDSAKPKSKSRRSGRRGAEGDDEEDLAKLLSAYLETEEAVQFLVDDKHPFVDHRPSTFQILRNLCGINNELYLQYIMAPAREKLTEGSSGAFMFHCGVQDELLVKTVSAEEKATLLRILPAYTAHMHGCRESLLVRFLGLHTLVMYGNQFHFVVMRNVFPAHVSRLVNERYDIKGSWIGRNATVVPPGQVTTCRYCNELYVSGSKDKCFEKIGAHEPNIVFKDNNLTNKFRLKAEDAYAVIETLHRDSDFLCSVGIMDYSMLVGIRNIEYAVDLAGLGGEETALRQGVSDAPGGRTSEASSSSSSSAVGAGQSANTGADASAPGVAIASPAPARPTAKRTSLAEDDFTTGGSSGGGGGLSIGGGSVMTGSGSGATGITVGAGGYVARAVVAPGMYYFGIIDILQSWTVEKRIERLVKVHLLSNPEGGLSCVPPAAYRDRFQKKVSEVIEHGIYVREITGSWKGNRAKTGPSDLLEGQRRTTIHHYNGAGAEGAGAAAGRGSLGTVSS